MTMFYIFIIFLEKIFLNHCPTLFDSIVLDTKRLVKKKLCQAFLHGFIFNSNKTHQQHMNCMKVWTHNASRDIRKYLLVIALMTQKCWWRNIFFLIFLNTHIYMWYFLMFKYHVSCSSYCGPENVGYLYVWNSPMFITWPLFNCYRKFTDLPY